MALLNPTNLGQLRGKMGEVVYYVTPDGKQHCRAHVTPKNPNTPAQMVQRGRFAIANRSLKWLSHIIRQGYGNDPYAYKGVVSHAIKEAVEGEYPDYRFNYGKVQLCRGTLQLPVNAGMSYQPATREVEFHWEVPPATLDYKGNLNDIVHVIAFHAGSFPEVHTLLAGDRGGGSYRYRLPDHWQAEQVHFWLHLLSYDLKKQTDSFYLGRAMP